MAAPVTTRGQEDAWKILQIHRDSVASLGKAQARFLTALLTFLVVLWGEHFLSLHDDFMLLGIKIGSALLWTIAPAVLTILSLGVIGSMNLMGPAWIRFSDAATAMGRVFFWSDIDVHKTIIDYLVLGLKIHPEAAVESTVPLTPAEELLQSRFRLSVFSYPAVLFFAFLTTLWTDYPGSSPRFKAYVFGLAGIQLLYQVRIWWRSGCKFFGKRRSKTIV
jgi:hypothetical protein